MQFKLCSLILLEKGTWLGITWGKTMQVRLSNTASRSVIPGKLTLALNRCPEVGEAERQVACSLFSSSRFPAEGEAHCSCAVFLDKRLEPIHPRSVEEFLLELLSVSVLQFLGSDSKL